MSAKTNKITIGADPEFCCIRNGRTLYAENYSDMGCAGADGGGCAFELRPDFSTDPLKVVSNIHKNFLQLNLKRPSTIGATYRAGSFITSCSQPLGGHIHFGGVDGISCSLASEWLDQDLGACSIIIEDREEGLRRRESEYGGKSDHRENDHGFEYRTVSSWLTSPYVAAAILCLAKTVIHEVVKSAGKSPTKRLNWDHFTDMNTPDVKAKFGDIWSDITKMELYNQYKLHIDLIYMLVKNDRTWFPQKSLKESWGIVDIKNAKVPTNPNFSLGAIWSQVRA